MRPALIALGFAVTLGAAEKVESSCSSGLEAAFESGANLKIRVRAGDVDVIGADAARIRVTCRFDKNPDRAADVKIRLDRSGGGSQLDISGGPTAGNFRATIEVPRQTHLFLRCPAGDLTVKSLEGDKDVELHAGDLKIDVGNPSDYARADASVRAGDLSAGPFNVRKSGLFRSFKKENPSGKYRFHAHIGAGDLTLR